MKTRVEFDPFKNPPKLVLVHGPPKSGKSTLIRSLIKNYTGQNIKELKGPITVKTSKKQRLTFMECPNEISKAMDLAKIADIVLTLVDASIGFEMETFEFLAVLQIHGFPRCIGVATHLDLYKNNDRRKKTKRVLRRRFEKEVSKETNLFFISEMHKEMYGFRDVHNLARLLSVIIPRELAFKTTHPHLLVDRFEMVAANQGGSLKDQDRVDVAVFGYVRGNEFVHNRDLYFCGLGYLKPGDSKEVPDPVPMNQL